MVGEQSKYLTLLLSVNGNKHLLIHFLIKWHYSMNNAVE